MQFAISFVLISNTDDHLRNPGFLYDGPDGWRLAPAYDLNPVPVDIKPRVLTTAIDLDDGTASLELAMGVCGELLISQCAGWKGNTGRRFYCRDEIYRGGGLAGKHEGMHGWEN